MINADGNITVLKINGNNLEEMLLDSNIEIIKNEVHNEKNTITFHIVNLGSRADIRVEVVLDKLRQDSIPYSYCWSEYKGNVNEGGEYHFRQNGTEKQHLSYLDSEKYLVNINDVRHALIKQGENAVFDLLDAAEEKFIPWEW